MIKLEEVDYKDLKMPASIATRRDIEHLVSEAEWADGELTQSSLSSKAKKEKPKGVTVSDSMAEFLNLNKLEFSKSGHRTALIKQLRKLKREVPVIHMTFAGELDGEGLKQIVDWVRRNLHSQAVVEASVQPSLVAGVYIRTTNSVYDLSARNRLEKSRKTLMKDLEALGG